MLYPLHPLTVHFPIALLLANTLFSGLYLRRKQPSFEISAYYCLVVGWVGACVALITGTIEAVLRVFSTSATHADALNWVNAHAAVGVTLLVVYGQALLRRRRNPRILDEPVQRVSYIRLLVLGAALVILDGWLGGHLVYALGVGVR